MNPQKIARVTGVLFVITFITSIPAALVLYVPVLSNPEYIAGAGGADNGVFLGASLELLLIIANIGTAVALWPVLKRVNESLALGYVTARGVECAFIAVGILSLLTLVTLRQEAAAGADAGSLVAVGASLVALHDWTFLLGPGFVVGVGNGLMLGYLMYRSLSCRGAWPCWGSSAVPWSSLRGSPSCSGSSRQGGCGRASRPSRSSFGSCRSASGSS